MSSLSIGYVPQNSGSNAYAARMQEILGSLGTLQPFQLKSLLRKRLKGELRPLDLLLVNWQENQVVSRQTRRISLRGALRMYAEALAMKLVARRMVFVRHNHYPHRTDPASAGFAQNLIDRYESLFDLVFVHSGDPEALRSGPHERRYLPHPLYRVDASEADQRVRQQLPERYFLVFGRIVPYKRIEYLMGQFPAAENLVVCGEVGDSAYSARLAKLSRGNVMYLPGYLPEEQAQALVAGAQAVIIGHAEPNMMVSGTFFYAISLHRHVFALRTPFLDWIAPRLGSAVLTLGQDVAQLCNLIAGWRGGPIPGEAQRKLAREFGDDSVRTVLTAAIKSLHLRSTAEQPVASRHRIL